MSERLSVPDRVHIALLVLTGRLRLGRFSKRHWAFGTTLSITLERDLYREDRG